MSDLDVKLRELGHRIMALDPKADYDFYLPELLDQIKQAFTDAGYLQSDVKEKADKLLQDMTNTHFNMKQDLLRTGMTPTPVKYTADFSNGKLDKLMTGREWHDRFEKEMWFMIAMTWADAQGKENHEILDRDHILKLAKKAAGIE